jgi:putative endonuclease
MPYYVYMMSNSLNTIIYVGATNDLARRVYEHLERLVSGFTKRYNVEKLFYYESFTDPRDAITREKALKGSSRSRKVKLIESVNPSWRDLWEEISTTG